KLADVANSTEAWSLDGGLSGHSWYSIFSGFALPNASRNNSPVAISITQLETGAGVAPSCVCSEAWAPSSSMHAPGPAASGRVAILVGASGSTQLARLMGALPEGVKMLDWTVENANCAGDGVHGIKTCGI